MKKASLKKFDITMRKQDKKFPTEIFYAAVFFPKIKDMKTHCAPYIIRETSAYTAAKAKALFLARTIGGWKKYQSAGWKIRKIKIMDMGPA